MDDLYDTIILDKKFILSERNIRDAIKTLKTHGSSDPEQYHMIYDTILEMTIIEISKNGLDKKEMVLLCSALKTLIELPIAKWYS